MRFTLGNSTVDVSTTCDCGREPHVTVEVEALTPLKTSFMPVPRCDQCQHWEGPSTTGQPSSMCTALDGQGGYGDVYGIVWTKPDFGCVLFTPKAVEQQSDEDARITRYANGITVEAYCAKSPDGTHHFDVDLADGHESRPRPGCTYCQEPW